MKNKKITEICGICAMLLFFFYVVWCGKSEERAIKRMERQVERTLKGMTTREKVAQLIVSQTDSYIFSEGHALMTDTLVGIEGIGGLLIIQDSLPRFLTRMNQLQEIQKSHCSFQ